MLNIVWLNLCELKPDIHKCCEIVTAGYDNILTANQIFTMSNVPHAFLTPLMKNTVSVFDWCLFRVLHTGPRKFKPSTRTSGVGAFRESYNAMPPAGPVVVVDYRTQLTHLPVIQSNAPKLIKLHPPFIYFSQVSAFRHTKAFRY